MSDTVPWPHRILSGAAKVFTAGALTGAAATVFGLVSARQFSIRSHVIPILPPEHQALRVLHLGDMHLGAADRRKIEFIRGLADLKPDLVINTGDNPGGVDAVDDVVAALAPLLEIPGVIVPGSNDLYGPRAANPLRYLRAPSSHDDSETDQDRIDTRGMFDRLLAPGGWHLVANRSLNLSVRDNLLLRFAGTHDAHLHADVWPGFRPAAIAAGEADELVWLLEHPALYTAGVTAKPADLLDADALPVFQSGRGGQYTYHGPGQRVAYVMLDLNQRGRDVRAFVRGLEAWIIGALGQFNVEGQVRDGRVGVWVERKGAGWSREDKIAAIGVKVRRWVSFHGISLNVEPDLGHFAGIVPCGISEHGVTSLVDLGLPVGMDEADAALQFIPTPGTEEALVYTSDVIAVQRGTTATAALVHFASFATEPDVQGDFSALKGSMPAVRDLPSSGMLMEHARGDYYQFAEEAEQPQTRVLGMSGLCPPEFNNPVQRALWCLIDAAGTASCDQLRVDGEVSVETVVRVIEAHYDHLTAHSAERTERDECVSKARAAAQ